MTTIFLCIIYAAFISLGLPDSMLGAAWPTIQPVFQVPYSYAGFISMIISGGTVVSSLLSSRLLKWLGTGKLTLFSVFMTAIALMGFSYAPSFIWLIFFAVPLGLGAGAVDSGLNTYVSSHYKSHHMNWLHCFWGIGALTGPALMSQYISQDQSWRKGYLTVSVIQFILVVILIFSLPLWDKIAKASKAESSKTETAEQQPYTVTKNFFQPLKVRGVKTALVSFLFYCGIEHTLGLWASSYFVQAKGLDAATAAGWLSIFFVSITVGRLISGFISLRISNKTIIRIGEIVILIGTILLIAPIHNSLSLAGFILIGFGCAPIYPCMLHETPARFGKKEAEDIMGFQMAVAYSGTTFLPPLFGFIASYADIDILPLFILTYIVILLIASEKLNQLIKKEGGLNGVFSEQQ